MMAQYLVQKEKAGEALLFYRMGDFYEMFFDDAEAAAVALDIALTKRGKHGGEDIPMCGVPVATAETYLSRLIAKGFKVAVCDQVEDPAEARKRGPKSVVQREIVRVVTPGTITEDELLDARAPAWLAAAAFGPGGAAALAWADVSTGAFTVCAVAADEVIEEIAALSPREVLAAEGALAGEDERVALARAGATITPLAKAKLDPRAGRRRLQEAFGVDDLDGFGAFEPEEVAAAGALVDYLQLTQVDAPVRLRPPRRAARGAHMAIDPATRASLELERTLQGARAGSLLATIDRTVTGPGARVLAGRLARPLTDVAAIAARHDAVAFFLDEKELCGELRLALKEAGDAARSLSRLLLGRGGPRDLARLASALAAGERICASFARKPLASPTADVTAALDAAALSDKAELAALARDLERTLGPDLPLNARDGGFVAAGVDAALDETRALRDESRRVIAALQTRYAETTGVAALKVKHNNVLGYFVEVTARHGEALLAAPLNATFIHRQTMANAVRFSTTELSELEARIAGATERARALELKIFDAFLERARDQADAISAAADALAQIDADAGFAVWARETNAVRPQMEDSGVFCIDDGRHPVVEAALARAGDGPFTPNGCALDAGGADGPRLVFVTGPNMAGKSTYLRQNALIAILAQAGSFAPAASARIGVVDRVFSRVGAADDLARGRSTFMAEMIETAAILNQAGPRALVILDEIGRGTATYDGLAIAWAVAEHMHEINGCRALFATHYHELTALADDLDAAANASLRAREWKGELVFLHEVGAGPADRSYGIEVARRAGLPKTAVARAKDVLSRLEDGASSSDALSALPLFAELGATPDAPGSAMEEALSDVDPDALSPREAHDLIYALKRLSLEGS